MQPKESKMDDKALLVAAAVGQLAAKEHAAFVARNSTRRALRKWFHAYIAETGEWFDPAQSEPEDIAAHDGLKATAKQAQKALTAARAATRRAIVRAAAARGAK